MFLTIFRIFHEIHNQVWETSAPAEETLRGAFWYDARPTIGGAVTVRRNFRESGYLERIRLNAGVQRGFGDGLRV